MKILCSKFTNTLLDIAPSLKKVEVSGVGIYIVVAVIVIAVVAVALIIVASKKNQKNSKVDKEVENQEEKK